MFSLFILLRASLKTTFVKERINVVRAYTGSSSRAVKVSTREAILALAAAVFFRLITPERRPTLGPKVAVTLGDLRRL